MFQGRCCASEVMESLGSSCTSLRATGLRGRLVDECLLSLHFKSFVYLLYYKIVRFLTRGGFPYYDVVRPPDP